MDWKGLRRQTVRHGIWGRRDSSSFNASGSQLLVNLTIQGMHSQHSYFNWTFFLKKPRNRNRHNVSVESPTSYPDPYDFESADKSTEGPLFPGRWFWCKFAYLAFYLFSFSHPILLTMYSYLHILFSMEFNVVSSLFCFVHLEFSTLLCLHAICL